MGDFRYAGQPVRVIDFQGGIWNLGASETLGVEPRTTLSINTTKSGKYKGRHVPYRVFIFDDFPDNDYSLIAPDLALASAVRSESPIECRYAERVMKQRLHQPA